MPDSFWLEMQGVEDDEFSAPPLEIVWSWVTQHEDGTIDYKVSVRIDRGSEVGAHQFMVEYFDPTRHNMLGLLKLTLDGLADYQMEMGK